MKAFVVFVALLLSPPSFGTSKVQIIEPSCQSLLHALNNEESGYVVLPKNFALPEDFIARAKQLEMDHLFPFNAESTYLVRDFDNFDIRNNVSAANREITELFKLSEKIKSLIERDVHYDKKASQWILSFAELRVDNNKEKYSTPHRDEDINDFVVIVPLTRTSGTLLWDPIAQQWLQAPVEGSPLIISTTRRSNPTLHQAPAISNGSVLILRFRLIPRLI